VPSKTEVTRNSASSKLYVAAGVVLVAVLIAAFVFWPTSEAKADVLGTARTARVTLLQTDRGNSGTARSLPAGQDLELLNSLPEMKPDAWAEVQLKADGSRGFVKNADLEAVHTGNGPFDLWHVALLLQGIEALNAPERTARVSQIEAVMNRYPAEVNDELRMRLAEMYTQVALALGWKMAQNDITTARAYLKSVKNQDIHSVQIARLNATLDGLAPPVVVNNASDDIYEKLLSEGKIEVDAAETEAQFAAVIAKMDRILKAKFNLQHGKNVQAEARTVREKAVRSIEALRK
jgi:hypothetical protein